MSYYENELYKQKYLKYKAKYLALKNQMGGVVHECNTGYGNNQDYYNVYRITQRNLSYIDQNYRYFIGRLDNYPLGCNLWVWNTVEPSPINNRNHLDIYVRDIDPGVYVTFGITAKVNGHSNFYNDQLIVDLQAVNFEQIGQMLAYKIDEVYHYIWG